MPAIHVLPFGSKEMFIACRHGKCFQPDCSNFYTKLSVPIITSAVTKVVKSTIISIYQFPVMFYCYRLAEPSILQAAQTKHLRYALLSIDEKSCMSSRDIQTRDQPAKQLELESGQQSLSIKRILSNYHG